MDRPTSRPAWPWPGEYRVDWPAPSAQVAARVLWLEVWGVVEAEAPGVVEALRSAVAPTLPSGWPVGPGGPEDIDASRRWVAAIEDLPLPVAGAASTWAAHHLRLRLGWIEEHTWVLIPPIARVLLDRGTPEAAEGAAWLCRGSLIAPWHRPEAVLPVAEDVRAFDPTRRTWDGYLEALPAGALAKLIPPEPYESEGAYRARRARFLDSYRDECRARARAYGARPARGLDREQVRWFVRRILRGQSYATILKTIAVARGTAKDRTAFLRVAVQRVAKLLHLDLGASL